MQGRLNLSETTQLEMTVPNQSPCQPLVLLFKHLLTEMGQLSVLRALPSQYSHTCCKNCSSWAAVCRAVLSVATVAAGAVLTGVLTSVCSSVSACNKKATFKLQK